MLQTVERAMALPIRRRKKYMKQRGFSPSLVLTPEYVFGQQVRRKPLASLGVQRGLACAVHAADLRAAIRPSPLPAFPAQNATARPRRMRCASSPAPQLAEESSFPLGVPLVQQLGLGGWRHCDVFRCDAPDGLHVFDEGVAFYLARMANKEGCVLWRVLNEALPNERERAEVLRRQVFCPAWDQGSCRSDPRSVLPACPRRVGQRQAAAVCSGSSELAAACLWSMQQGWRALRPCAWQPPAAVAAAASGQARLAPLTLTRLRHAPLPLPTASTTTSSATAAAT